MKQWNCPTLTPRMAAKSRRQLGRTKPNVAMRRSCSKWSEVRHDWPGAWGNMDIFLQLGGVGFLRPNLQHGASIERGDHGSAIGSGNSGLRLGTFLKKRTALSIHCAGATSHSTSFNLRQSPEGGATHLTKSGLRVLGFCPAGSIRKSTSSTEVVKVMSFN